MHVGRRLLYVVGLFGFLLVSFNNCGMPGTQLSSLSEAPQALRLQSLENKIEASDLNSTYATEIVLGEICHLVASCYYGSEYSSCRDGVLKSSYLQSALGLGDPSYSSNFSLIEAERAGRISIQDASILGVCRSEIRSLTCNLPEVQQAYQPSMEPSYDNVVFLLNSQTTQCRHLLIQKGI